jgi:hypothetical protein
MLELVVARAVGPLVVALREVRDLKLLQLDMSELDLVA